MKETLRSHFLKYRTGKHIFLQNWQIINSCFTYSKYLNSDSSWPAQTSATSEEPLSPSFTHSVLLTWFPAACGIFSCTSKWYHVSEVVPWNYITKQADYSTIVRFDHRFHAPNGNGRTHQQASIHCFLISIRIRDSASSALKHKTIQMGIQEFIKTYWLSDWKKI